MVTIKSFSAQVTVVTKAKAILNVLSEEYCRERLKEYKSNCISIAFLLGVDGRLPRAQDIKAIKDYLRDTNINHLKQLLKAETFQLLEFIKDLPDFRSFIPEFSTGKRYIGVKSLRLLADWNKMIVDTMCLSSIEREKLHDKRVRDVKSLQKNEIKQFEKAVTQFVKRFSQSDDSKKQSNILSQRNLYNMSIGFQEEGKKKLKSKSYYSSSEAGFEAFKRFVKDFKFNLDAAPQLKAKLWEIYKEHYKKRLTFLRVSFGYLAIYHDKLNTSPATVLKRVTRLIRRHKLTK